MPDDLDRARKSLGRGRMDEALLYLWNAVEPARMEGRGALRDLERLAAEVRARGDESQKAEAERLLASLRQAEAPPEQPARPAYVDVAQEEEPPAPSAEQPVPAEVEEAPERRGGLGRYLLPIVVALVILVNVIARAFGGD